MTKLGIGCSLVVATILALAALQSSSQAGLAQSHHDFSDASWTGNEMCVPCHTPHDADTSVTAAPLWDHEVTAASFTPYSSPTLNAVPGQPGGTSKLCLSCHDGTVAMDSFGGQTGTRIIAAKGRIGTNLSGHHPISFVYDAALATADGELFDPSSTSSGLGGTIAEDLLRGGRLECTSCHDVHISRNTQGCSGCHFVHGQVYGETLSLWKSNANSAFCFTCHDK